MNKPEAYSFTQKGCLYSQQRLKTPTYIHCFMCCVSTTLPEQLHCGQNTSLHNRTQILCLHPATSGYIGLECLFRAHSASQSALMEKEMLSPCVKENKTKFCGTKYALYHKCSTKLQTKKKKSQTSLRQLSRLLVIWARCWAHGYHKSILHRTSQQKEWKNRAVSVTF